MRRQKLTITGVINFGRTTSSPEYSMTCPLQIQTKEMSHVYIFIHTHTPQNMGDTVKLN